MNRIFNVFFSIVLSVMALFLFMFNPDSEVVWIIPLLINLLIMWDLKDNKLILIMLFFLMTYNLTPYYFFVEGIKFSGWETFHDVEITNQTAVLCSLFITSLYAALYNVDKEKLVNISELRRESGFVFIISIIFASYSFLFGLSGQSLLSGQFDSDYFSKTALFGYFTCFILIALMSAKERYNKLILLLVFLYSIKGFLYGARIEVLQTIFLLVIFKTNLLRTISYKKLFLIIIFAFIVLKFVERFRTMPSDIITLLTNFDFLTLYDVMFIDTVSVHYLSNNQGDIYHSSNRIIGMVNNGEFSWKFSFMSLSSFLLNPFLLFSDEFRYLSDLSSYKKGLYNSGGGAFISHYFYVWLGYGGVILSGIFIGLVIKLLYRPGCLHLKVYAVMVFVTVFRWYGYNPIQLVKICFYTMILSIFLFSLSRLIFKASHEKSNI